MRNCSPCRNESSSIWPSAHHRAVFLIQSGMEDSVPSTGSVGGWSAGVPGCTSSGSSKKSLSFTGGTTFS